MERLLSENCTVERGEGYYCSIERGRVLVERGGGGTTVEKRKCPRQKSLIIFYMKSIDDDERRLSSLKGAVSRDFLPFFHFMNRTHLGP